jgi:hypothetical protein
MEAFEVTVCLSEDGFKTVLPGMDESEALWRSLSDPDSLLFLQSIQQHQVPEELREEVGDRDFSAQIVTIRSSQSEVSEDEDEDEDENDEDFRETDDEDEYEEDDEDENDEDFRETDDEDEYEEDDEDEYEEVEEEPLLNHDDEKETSTFPTNRFINLFSLIFGVEILILGTLLMS